MVGVDRLGHRVGAEARASLVRMIRGTLDNGFGSGAGWDCLFGHWRLGLCLQCCGWSYWTQVRDIRRRCGIVQTWHEVHLREWLAFFAAHVLTLIAAYMSQRYSAMA